MPIIIIKTNCLYTSILVYMAQLTIQQTLQSPKHLAPIRAPAGRFNEEYLVKQWNGQPPNILGQQPIQNHTQHVERSWRELKKILSKCNSKNIADSYIDEWMYRTNILDPIGNIQAQFQKCVYVIKINRYLIKLLRSSVSWS